MRRPPYEVRRLGWGTFTLEAEVVLKEPYSWVLDNTGTRQAGLELTWTLSFSGWATGTAIGTIGSERAHCSS
jgi:hypothetical protein